MNLIETLIGKLQAHPKRFVFTDGNDPRVLQAARQIVTRKMGAPILIGDRTSIKVMAAKLDINTKGIRIIEPERSSDINQMRDLLRSIPRFAGLSDEEIEARSVEPCVFATLLLKSNRADALVSGATTKASNALRALFQLIGTQTGVKTASSLLVIDMEEKEVGIHGALFMSDCGVIPDPDAEQLADIVITTASLAHHLTNERPKVALLSFSTYGNPRHPSVAKVQAATALAREKAKKIGLEADIDGDLQIDAALDRATAQLKKTEGSLVAGDANVLIFPDLTSGNIATKLIHLLSGANKYGQIIMGLNKPAVEISRGATAHDILGAAAISGCQAIDHRLLFGMGENPDVF